MTVASTPWESAHNASTPMELAHAIKVLALQEMSSVNLTHEQVANRISAAVLTGARNVVAKQHSDSELRQVAREVVIATDALFDPNIRVGPVWPTTRHLKELLG